MSKERRVYSREFKNEAVALAKRKEKALAEIERELGMSSGLLKNWVKAAELDGSEAFPGHGKLKSSEEEVRQLRRENEWLRAEREILKKAISIFSQPGVRTTNS